MTRRHKTVLNAGYALLGFLCFPMISAASPCDCREIDLQLEVSRAYTIFTGVVVETRIVPLTSDEVPQQMEMTTKMEDENEPLLLELGEEKRVVSFEVSEILKGTLPSIATVEVYALGSNCDFAFQMDEEYLVFAFVSESPSPNPRPLQTSSCARTALLEDSAELISQLRGGPEKIPADVPPDLESSTRVGTENCRCVEISFEEELDTTYAIFAGKVQETRTLRVSRFSMASFSQSLEMEETRSSPGEDFSLRQITRFEVKEVFKGDLPDIITLELNALGTACDIDFKSDEEYLVFAYLPASEDLDPDRHKEILEEMPEGANLYPVPLETSGCTRTLQLENSSRLVERLRTFN